MSTENRDYKLHRNKFNGYKFVINLAQSLPPSFLAQSSSEELWLPRDMWVTHESIPPILGSRQAPPRDKPRDEKSEPTMAINAKLDIFSKLLRSLTQKTLNLPNFLKS